MLSNKNALISSKSPFVSVAANPKVTPNSKHASNSKLGVDSKITNISIDSNSSAPISSYAKESPKRVNAVEPKPNLQKSSKSVKHDSAEELHKDKTHKPSIRVKRKKTKSNKSEALHLYEDEPHGTMAQFLRGFTVPGPQDKNNEVNVRVRALFLFFSHFSILF